MHLLRSLIRFDTSNPPGNEGACVRYVLDLLLRAGVDATLVEENPGRPNLVARLKGKSKSAPLLLYGHVDVVVADAGNWRHPPFEGTIEEGYIWGRGTLDMKGAVSMLLAAFLRAKLEETPLPGDVILVLVVNEERGSEGGAAYLVREHPKLFADVRYAIGEFGGFGIRSPLGQRFYLIQVAEKQLCHLRARIPQARTSHGALAQRNGATARAGRLLDLLTRRRLPVHVTRPVREFLSSLAEGTLPQSGDAARRLLLLSLTQRALDLPLTLGGYADALMRNTVSVTGVYGAGDPYGVSDEVVVDLSARLLPGQGPEDIVRELQVLWRGLDARLEVQRYDEGPPPPDMGLFPVLGSVLREVDPGGIAVPYMVPGTTDARFFARLGIQTYGFVPVIVAHKANFALLDTMHAVDERIPAGDLALGAAAVHKVLRRFGEG